jgi:hypothetical protein
MKEGQKPHLPEAVSFIAPMRLSVATSIPENNIGLVASPLKNQTSEYATAHVPSAKAVNEAAQAAIRQTDAMRKEAGEALLTKSEREKLIQQELTRAGAHENADLNVRDAEKRLSDMTYPGPNYASEAVQARAIENARKKLEEAKQEEIATDLAMLSSLRGH